MPALEARGPGVLDRERPFEQSGRQLWTVSHDDERPPSICDSATPLVKADSWCEHLYVNPSAEAIELGLNLADPTTLVVDLNCAFASIEQQHDPSLRGKVLAIAAYATDAATIVSSSREARDLGIKTGMKVFEAKALFPTVIVREPNPPRYRDVSDKLIEILRRHSPDVLRMSIDEASLDLAGTPDLKRLGPEGVARPILLAIREEVGECVTATAWSASTTPTWSRSSSAFSSRISPASPRPARAGSPRPASRPRCSSCAPRRRSCAWRACTRSTRRAGACAFAASRSEASRAHGARATATLTSWPTPPPHRKTSRSS